MARKKIRFTGLQSLPFEEWETPEETHAPPMVRKSPYSHITIHREEEDKEKSLPGLLYYFSMGSGSSGNSSYIGTTNGGIIIDAGLRADRIEAALREQGIDIANVHAVLLTHDHTDHIKSVYTLVRNHRHLKVFCTNRVLNGVLRRHGIASRLKDYHQPIFKEIPFKIGDLEITAFEVPHDGTDNMGFSIVYDSRHFVLATDMGTVTSRARHYISLANYLVVESNYDLQMLLDGPYPEYLKARIQTEMGHMDNKQTASLLKEIAGPHLSHVFLCHLSKENNTPEIALKSARRALEEIGLKVGSGMNTLEDRKADIQLMALPRFESTPLFVFRPKLVDQHKA